MDMPTCIWLIIKVGTTSSRILVVSVAHYIRQPWVTLTTKQSTARSNRGGSTKAMTVCSDKAVMNSIVSYK